MKKNNISLKFQKVKNETKDLKLLSRELNIKLYVK